MPEQSEGVTDAATFFRFNRAALKEAAALGGPAVVELIRTFETFAERLIMYTLARQALIMEDGGLHGGLDCTVAVADAGIAEVERLLPAAEDAVERQNLLRALHMLNFNLAADLADCWPGDELPRERRHFERGLKAGDALLARVFEGAVLPHVLANDHWVRGMHQLSLGEFVAARESWGRALVHAAEAARRGAMPPAGRDSSLQVLLITGYFGLAGFLRGQESRDTGPVLYGAALADLAFRAQNPEDSEEASFFIQQLEKVRQTYAPALPGRVAE